MLKRVESGDSCCNSPTPTPIALAVEVPDRRGKRHAVIRLAMPCLKATAPGAAAAWWATDHRRDDTETKEQRQRHRRRMGPPGQELLRRRVRPVRRPINRISSTGHRFHAVLE